MTVSPERPLTASSSADPKRAAQTGAEDPGTQTDQDAQRFRQSDDTETGETERDETDAGTDAGTDVGTNDCVRTSVRTSAQYSRPH